MRPLPESAAWRSGAKMPYDPRRHHRRSVRLQGHDYGAGAYFVTICAHTRAPLFGTVDAGRMIPNALGMIVLEESDRSMAIRREIELVAVALMPNHLHGLIVLNPDARHGDLAGVGARLAGSSPLIDTERSGPTPFRRSPRSLGSFVGGFKAASTSKIKAASGTADTPIWQRGFHEHLVRDDAAMVNIVNYILTNPIRWSLDPENPDRTDTDAFDDWLIRDTHLRS